MWQGKSSYAIRMSVRVVGAWPKNCCNIALSHSRESDNSIVLHYLLKSPIV